jgi:hypothetical protein
MINGMFPPSEKNYRCPVDVAHALAVAQSANGKRISISINGHSFAALHEIDACISGLRGDERTAACQDVLQQVLAVYPELSDIYCISPDWSNLSCPSDNS